MEKITRTYEVTIEKSEFRVVRSRRQSVSVWCDRCERQARMVSPEKISCAVPRCVYQWIERGTVYFAELPDGLLVVCAGCVSRKVSE